MTAVQIMCARLGMVSGRGLAGVIRHRYPKWVLWSACALLIVANVVNIGADLGGMAEATELISGVSSFVWLPIYTIGIGALLFWTSYRTIAKIFKWLTVVLFAYVLAAFLARPDWGAVLRATVMPSFERSSAYWAALVGILGTTVSPYLFFWQAAQEVEEEAAMGRLTVHSRRGATARELRRSRTDIMTGMFFAVLVMYFIMLTAAATLHAHGHKDITTARQAAEALRPLAGPAAYWLFSLGLIGAGMLGVPALAGSCAYAVGEAANWVCSLEHKPHLARGFYSVMGVAMLIGLGLDFAGFDAVKMLFWSAVVNGVLAPPLIVLVVLLTGNRTVMGDKVCPRSLRALGWICAALMAGAAVLMFATAR